MFLFEGYTLANVLMAILVLAGLFLINEVTRRSKIASIIFYIAIPIIFTIFVWPKTAGAGTTSGYWFAWVKTYSALAGVIGFMALRYFKKLQANKYMLFFPAFILAANIAEAVYRDFECYNLDGVIQNGLLIQGGFWNILNGIAGIISIITITGWVGIKIAKTKNKDMVWPDQQWFWIIAYGLWNLSYVYNCISDRAFYAGLILVVVSTGASFVSSKGVWLQHRAQTLAIWAMFSLTYPAYAVSKYFSITSTHDIAPLIVLSVLSLLANIAVLAYEIKIIVKTRRNPLKEEIYVDLKSYNEVLEVNKL